MEDAALRCPTCGAAVSENQLRRFGGACSRCVLLFVAEDSPPQFPNLQLQEVLGRGGMGVVYRALQPHLNRSVALKVLSPKLMDEPGALERFTREAAAMAKLQHPHIVTLYDFGVHAGVPFLILEHVEGASLRKALQDGPLPPARAVAIARTLCDALDYAHRRGVVHRDLKPENVLLDRDGRLKLADFGLARLNDSASKRLTGTDASMGTPGYMAPEQIERAGEVDARADLYSLGILLYEMLTGRLPLGRFAPPSLDRRLDGVVHRLLEREPERRFATAEGVKEALDRATAPRRKSWVLAAVLASAAALPAAFSWPRGRAEPPAPTPAPAAPAWAELPGIAPGPESAWYPALVSDRSGRPVAAWQEGAAPRSLIRVARWTGSAWKELGRPPSRVADVGHPSLAVDPEGRTWLAWHESRAGNFEVYVSRATEAGWEDFRGSSTDGGISDSPGASTRPWLALDPEGRPVVAWCERHARDLFDLRACRWDGKAWMPLPGLAAFSSQQLPSPIVAVDPAGRVLIAWRSSDATSTRYRVHRLEAGRWRELEGLTLEVDAPGLAWERVNASMVLDAAGHPVVAYGCREAPVPLLRVRRWDGKAWRSLGDVVDGGVRDAMTQALPALGLDPAGDPWVAWTYGRPARRVLHVSRWKDGAWTEIGRFDFEGTSPSLTYTTPFRQAMAADGRGGFSIAAVDMAEGAWRLRVLRREP